MWFRNLLIYRLKSPFEYSTQTLQEHLQLDAFRDCTALEHFSYGWVPPLGKRSSELVHAASGRLLVAARKEEKVLPAAVIREEVERRVEAIEIAEARPVGRKQRQDLKDDVIHELMSKAFTKSNITYAYIDPTAQLLVVDAASTKKAEELISQLRHSIERLSLVPIQLKVNPAIVMTRWLNRDLSSGLFEPQDECELIDGAEDGGIVRCRRQDLYSDELQAHLDAGKQVTRLSLLWNERIRCLVDKDFTIRRLKFEDIVGEELERMDSDDELALFDAQFALMVLELNAFIPAMIEAFGGEDDS